jgi:hypothetical protein
MMARVADKASRLKVIAIRLSQPPNVIYYIVDNIVPKITASIRIIKKSGEYGRQSIKDLAEPIGQ